MEIKAIDNSDIKYHSHVVTATPAAGKNMIRQLTRTQSKLSSSGQIGRNATFEISGFKSPQIAPAATDGDAYQQFVQVNSFYYIHDTTTVVKYDLIYKL